MKSVIYISTKAQNFLQSDLGDLVEYGTKRNAADNITGCLVFNGMNFMQLIEGADDAIDACMARIAKDDRHSGVVTIRERECEARECPEWGMVGLAVSKKPTAAERKEIETLLRDAQADTQNMFGSFTTL